MSDDHPMTAAADIGESTPPPPSESPRRCADPLDMKREEWSVRTLLQRILVPVSNAVAPAGDESSSRRKKDSLEMEKIEKRRQARKPVFKVEDIVGGDGILNTQTGPVAVVLYPYLSKILLQCGYEWLTDNPKVNPSAEIDDLTHDDVRALQRGADAVNFLLQPLDPLDQEQNEKFTERIADRLEELLYWVIRVLKGFEFRLNPNTSSVPAHIPDALIRLARSIRGLVELKKGKAGKRVVAQLVRFAHDTINNVAASIEARGGAAAESRLYGLCALSDLPGSPTTGSQNLVGKLAQSLQSIDRSPESGNDPFLGIFIDYDTFVPLVALRLPSIPPELPLPSLCASAKERSASGVLQVLYTPKEGYEPYILVVGAPGQLDSPLLSKPDLPLTLENIDANLPCTLACSGFASAMVRDRIFRELINSGSLLAELGLQPGQAAIGGRYGSNKSATAAPGPSAGPSSSRSYGGAGGYSRGAGVEVPANDSSDDLNKNMPVLLSPATAKAEYALAALSRLPALAVTPTSSYARPFRRLSLDELHKQANESGFRLRLPPRDIATAASVVVDSKHMDSGSHAYVYMARLEPDCGLELVLKMSANEEDGTDQYIAHEGILYEKYGSQLEDVLPRYAGTYVGSWQNDVGVGILLEKFGQCFEDWDELSPSQRTAVMALIKKLHAVGLEHRDLKPWNILHDPETGKVKLVDLSRAKEHKCPGDEDCGELVKARSLLAVS